MKDEACKKIGAPFSTSRAWEKKMKHKTIKYRRQQAKRITSYE
jgi:hypothetical protein